VGDTVRFVDSVASSPTLRLDLNDETVWACTNFDAPPPRLKRSVASNIVTPGGYVGSSAHDLRLLTISLEVITNTQDLGATELQKLARELDRPTNVLQYQPTGATKPVFFKTYRSDVSAVLDMVAAKTYRNITIEVLADPYALGLEETLVNAATINNDPAHATNPMGLTLGTVLGDVPAPLRVVASASGTGMVKMPLLGITTMHPGYTIASRPIFFQCESATTSTDTTVTADATMSGGSKMRTTPGTTSTTTRWLATLTGYVPGEYRVFVRCAKTVGTDVWEASVAQDYGGGSIGPGVRHAFSINTTSPVWVDCGVVALGLGNANADPSRLVDVSSFRFQAGRTSGTGSLDSDAIIFIPVAGPRIRDNRVLITDLGGIANDSTVVWDTEADSIYSYVTATGKFSARLGNTSTGGMPWVYPNHTNYLWYMAHATHYTVRNVLSPYVATDVLTQAVTLSAFYNPRYLYVRPSAS
jgi:hypothetical protein